jgi:hypothetical protein
MPHRSTRTSARDLRSAGGDSRASTAGRLPLAQGDSGPSAARPGAGRIGGPKPQRLTKAPTVTSNAPADRRPTSSACPTTVAVSADTSNHPVDGFALKRDSSESGR